MSNLMYQMSAPVFTHQLKNLAAILKTAAKDAKARGIDPSVLLSARLAPDMLPLISQVRIACDHAKGACARLAGVEAPAHADDEETFADLQARIKNTLAFIRTTKAGQYAGSEEREIVMKIPIGSLGFNGIDYLTGWALPNFYFHYSTAYAILRDNGVALGKGDFLGQVPGMSMSGKIAKMMQKKN
jgi:hypothetical protein